MIPNYQTLMLPLLRVARDGQVRTVKEGRELLAAEFQLSEEELSELLPSGQQPVFTNRVAWAKVYLEKAGLLESPKRAHFRITDRGRKVLETPPEKIDVKFLRQFEEFVTFRTKKTDKKAVPTFAPADDSGTPEELLESAHQQLRSDLTQQLLTQIKGGSPSFFERLVVDLLVKMGYGGSRQEAGKVVGRGGDEGIDGVISEDRLGLDVIYVQAKKWEGSVGRPEIQKFVGALHGKRAKKGVFITTSTFSSGGRDYVETIESKVVLIDGERLAQLMIDFGLGVSAVAQYDIKRLDLDYFEDV